MKKIYYILLATILFSSCRDLDLAPLSEATNENWFSDEKEISMSVNAMYNPAFWSTIGEDWTDNEAYRTSNTSFVNGTLTSQDGSVAGVWSTCYKGIARANIVIQKLSSLPEGVLSENMKKQFLGELLCTRANLYTRLTFHFGDVPLVVEPIDIDVAFTMGRTEKSTVIKQVYEDFDNAIEMLGTTNGAIKRMTKGVAMALKARAALYNGDYKLAADAAKSCIDLGCYELYPSYKELFYPGTTNTKESIFALPRSIVDKSTIWVGNQLPRNHGGWAALVPTWDLLASYTCTDGLPIDESPLFDPHDPFKNRDPRCSETIVPFNSNFLGIMYSPHPDSVFVQKFTTGEKIKNQDTKSFTQHASYSALVWKKGLNEMCLQNGNRIDPENVIIRYADVLLIYAEAKIEMNEIDQSVLDAINKVRARAYGVTYEQTSKYPAVTTTSQKELITILRTERRMEFAKEGTRYFDLIRWKLAEKCLTIKNYGILYPANDLQDKVIKQGHWFWAKAPKIDENGVADFTELEDMGVVNVLSQRSFDKRQYLWPIPSKEILVNDNMKQNPGY